jgi:hypothetical protein
MKRQDDLGDALAALTARAHENPERPPIGVPEPTETPAKPPEEARRPEARPEKPEARSEPKKGLKTDSMVNPRKEPLPWEGMDERIPAHFTLRAKAPLHAKLVYVADRSLGRPTLHSIAIEILEQGLNERLRAMGIEVK